MLLRNLSNFILLRFIKNYEEFSKNFTRYMKIFARIYQNFFPVTKFYEISDNFYDKNDDFFLSFRTSPKAQNSVSFSYYVNYQF